MSDGLMLMATLVVPPWTYVDASRMLAGADSIAIESGDNKAR